jgi:hypothetical protein
VRFMMIVKATKDSEAGVMPSEELLAAMGKYNEELANAGVLLAGEGLHPSSKGARVRFSGEGRTVVEGPFPETEHLIAGFWLIQVGSLAEAIEWARRCPNPMLGESEIEIRQVLRPRISATRSRPSSGSRRSGCAHAPPRGAEGKEVAPLAALRHESPTASACPGGSTGA